MTDRCACSHLWSDHAVSCYGRDCPCNCQPVPVRPAPDTALREAAQEAKGLLERYLWDGDTGAGGDEEFVEMAHDALRAALEADRD